MAWSEFMIVCRHHHHHRRYVQESRAESNPKCYTDPECEYNKQWALIKRKNELLGPSILQIVKEHKTSVPPRHYCSTKIIINQNPNYNKWIFCWAINHHSNSTLYQTDINQISQNEYTPTQHNRLVICLDPFTIHAFTIFKYTHTHVPFAL